MIDYKKRHYYLVVAKCGHVGRGKYIEICFPVYAESRHEAAQMILMRPKVKRHLKNAITNTYEVDYNKYLKAKELFENNDYVKAHYKKEIIKYFDETNRLDKLNRTYTSSFKSRIERINFIMKKNRIMEEQIIC